MTKEAPPQIKTPKMYQIILYNDDFTPMDFVVEILRLFFLKSKAKASEIMLKVHTVGKAVCGIYTKNIAETKVSQVRAYAAHHEYPLRCEMIALDS
jgi:ATP-dependent Clp protease adaptor protein ClpS